MALSGITIKFLKVFACKIRIINKKASLKEGAVQDCKLVLDYSKSLEDDLANYNKPKYTDALKAYLWKYAYLTIFYPLVIFKRRKTRTHELLRPQLPFYFLELISSAAFSWILAVFCTSLV